MTLEQNPGFHEKIRRLACAVRIGLWAHAPSIVVIVLGYFASALMLGANDEQISFGVGSATQQIVGMLPGFIFAMAAIGLLLLLFIRERYRILLVVRDRLRAADWIELALMRLPIAIMLMIMSAYVLLLFKVNIANLNPYAWDHAFVQADRFLFMGYDPWIMTHRIFSTPAATKLIDNLYLVWFFVQQTCVLFAAFLPLRDELRLTFLLAYLLSWMLGGIVLATLMPAVGPVYLEALTGDPLFRPLIDLLHEQSKVIEIKALTIQHELWLGFTDPSVEPLGVSAFPSMHVHMATIFACFGFALHRAAGWALTAFAAVTFIGSVHLGWHYAIDGIAGIGFAIVLWHASRAITRWWLSRIGLAAAPADPNSGLVSATGHLSSPDVADPDQVAPAFAKNRFSTSR